MFEDIKRKSIRWLVVGTVGGIFAAFGLEEAGGAEGDYHEELLRVKAANVELQQQLQQQRELIDSLSAKVARLEETEEDRSVEWQALKDDVAETMPSASQKLSGFGEVRLSGQLAAAFFHTGSDGATPNGEFRIDEARLFVDARVWEDVYAYTELNVVTRETPDENVHLGEAYIDFERVLKKDGWERSLNVRLGRFQIPFGEEYLVRYALDNPLISHSLADFWGIDEGVEIFGSIGKVQYVTAVQNGGHPALRDFTSDKSVAGRVSYQPSQRLRFSVSGMRTGRLAADSEEDRFSELWFGNGFIRSLGDPDTTSRFHANLVEGDVAWFFRRGHLKGAGGYLYYDDNDSARDNSRDVYFYSLEGVFDFTDKFYGATRFSQILADEGFPIVGYGRFGEHQFRTLTSDLWRLSFGLGYRPNRNLVFKMEYSLEHGETLDGEQRDQEDFLGAQAAVRF